MSHFANIENGMVTKVIVAEQDFIDGQDGHWVQTSYNTYGGIHYGQPSEEPPHRRSPDGGIALRKNYAGIGYTYDEQRDAFIPPKPFPSWSLDEPTCTWEAPTPHPNDGSPWDWNEQKREWIKWIPPKVKDGAE